MHCFQKKTIHIYIKPLLIFRMDSSSSLLSTGIDSARNYGACITTAEMGNPTSESSSVHDGTSVSDHEPVPASKPKNSVFRSVPFQIAVASGVSFTAPGMWDALNNLGAGGAAEPYAVSGANALVYGLFFIVCIAAGAINNRIGLRYGLALGAVGYPIYGAGLYVNNTRAVTWFMLFGSALCGLSAGFFWAAEAAVM